MPAPHHTPTDADLIRLRSGLRCEAINLADAPADALPGHAGRWRLNSGAVMAQYLWSLDRDHPVLVVLDLATCTPARAQMRANYMHHGWDLVGRWVNVSVSPTGVEADLLLYVPTESDAETTRERLSAAAYVADLLRRDHPWECSIEGDDGRTVTYERVLPGSPVTVNGSTYQAEDYDRPLYIARHCTLVAAAIVDQGADPDTARIAAQALRRTHPTTTHPETATMPTAKERLAALRAKHPATRHGLIASAIIAEQTDDEIEQAIAAEDLKDAQDQVADLAAKLAAAQTQIDELTAKLAAADAEDDDAAAVAARAAATGAALSASGSTATIAPAGSEAEPPATFHAAMRLVCGGDSTLRGPAARAEIFRRWPSLRPQVS
jgi:hypothetical protein